jgi:hypothetical protein
MLMYDSKGNPRRCMHDNCNRIAVRIIAYERPQHKQFEGQTHDCCSVHSRATKSNNKSREV